MNDVRIEAGREVLFGNLNILENATTLVLFAHGSGSSRHSPRNQFVARTLNNAGLATLLFDLLTQQEEAIDMRTREHRFNIALLAERLVHATKWAKQQEQTRDLRAGYFGSSTGGAAALVAAAELPQDVGAVVSRGGRPDLAGEALPKVQAPTLLIVGGNDDVVIELNEQARDRMRCEVKLEIVPGATHLFEEPGALEQVAALTVTLSGAKLAIEEVVTLDSLGDALSGGRSFASFKMTRVLYSHCLYRSPRVPRDFLSPKCRRANTPIARSGCDRQRGSRLRHSF